LIFEISPLASLGRNDNDVIAAVIIKKVIILYTAKYNYSMDEREYQEFSYRQSLMSAEKQEPKPQNYPASHPKQQPLRKAWFWVFLLFFAAAAFAAVVIANNMFIIPP